MSSSLWLNITCINLFPVYRKIRIWSLSTNSLYPAIVSDMSEVGLSCAYASMHKTVMVGTRRGHVDVYKIHLPPPKLVNLCRLVINKSVIKPDRDFNLPKELKSFLFYDNIRTNSVAGSKQATTRGHSLIVQNMPMKTTIA